MQFLSRQQWQRLSFGINSKLAPKPPYLRDIMDGDYVVLTVSDNGLGISAKDMKKIIRFIEAVREADAR